MILFHMLCDTDIVSNIFSNNNEKVSSFDSPSTSIFGIELHTKLIIHSYETDELSYRV